MIVIGPTACGSVAATMSDASLPPHVQIIQMGTAYWVSQFVCTAANMRLADHLADGPRSASELTAVTGANPRALHRFMRTLASLGLLTQDTGARFALTPLGAALKSDAPGAARATVLSMGGQAFRSAFAEFQVLSRDRQDRDGESLRHAALRLSGAASARGRAVQ